MKIFQIFSKTVDFFTKKSVYIGEEHLFLYVSTVGTLGVNRNPGFKLLTKKEKMIQ